MNLYYYGMKIKNSNLKISIARPGFVFSKMTSGFDPAPFALNLEECAKILVKGIIKERKKIYAPRKLSVLMGIVKYLPRSIFNKLG